MNENDILFDIWILYSYRVSL